MSAGFFTGMRAKAAPFHFTGRTADYKNLSRLHVGGLYQFPGGFCSLEDVILFHASHLLFGIL